MPGVHNCFSWTRSLLQALILPLALLAFDACGRESHTEYDVVIQGGRVVDPESNLDAVRNLGILHGTIQTITEQPINGRTQINAKGLIASPGFIDLHAHGQTEESYRVYVMDGVTTALEMEIGIEDVDSWYRERKGKSRVHYGATVSHPRVRMQVMEDPGIWLPTGDAANRLASDSELEQIKKLVGRGLQRGALGVGFGIQYTPAASRLEILEMFRIAARYNAPAYTHMRYMGLQEPNNSVSALQEVLAASAISGAPLHIVHLKATGRQAFPYLIEAVHEAQSRGLDVTAECYPYTKGMTEIESAVFDEGWQEKLGVSYEDLQWAETNERLTKETFARYRKTGGLVLIPLVSEELMETAVSNPYTIIASDGILRNGHGHPRTSGTYCRILGRFVREKGALTWSEAIRKMSLMPAVRLEGRVPKMRNKGRIQIGADADLAIFDPETVIDRATYQSPAEFSVGMRYVLVGGTPVVMDGRLQEKATPGQAIRAAVESP